MINEKYLSEYEVVKCDSSDEAMRVIEEKKKVKIIIHFIHDRDTDNPHLSLFIDRAGIKQIFVIDGFERSLSIPVAGYIMMDGEFTEEKLYKAMDKAINNNPDKKSVILITEIDKVVVEREIIMVSNKRGSPEFKKFLDELKYALSDGNKHCNGRFTDGKKYHISKTLKRIKAEYSNHSLRLTNQCTLLNLKYVPADYEFNIRSITLIGGKIFKFSTRITKKLISHKIKSLKAFDLFFK
jgi:hypothetical protein